VIGTAATCLFLGLVVAFLAMLVVALAVQRGRMYDAIVAASIPVATAIVGVAFVMIAALAVRYAL